MVDRFKLLIVLVALSIPPSVRCTNVPTVAPTQSTSRPTKQPTESPTTKRPTTRSPTNPPTDTPTRTPTRHPTQSPSRPPTAHPTHSPSYLPTLSKPTRQPTTLPTTQPTSSPPTMQPTGFPTLQPTQRPTLSPTARPTTTPTRMPSFSPSLIPTASPTSSTPTSSPTLSPSLSQPTRSPTLAPTTSFPTQSPTHSPTTSRPTAAPTHVPTTVGPTKSPTISPTQSSPTRAPTSSQPTLTPTHSTPTRSPTISPSQSPTVSPSDSPTRYPTANFSHVCDADVNTCTNQSKSCSTCIGPNGLKSATRPRAVYLLTQTDSSNCLAVPPKYLLPIVKSCEKLTAGEQKDSACVEAAYECILNDTSCAACLPVVFGVTLANKGNNVTLSRATFNNVFTNSKCTTTESAYLEPVIQECFTPCELALFKCSRHADCQPYINGSLQSATKMSGMGNVVPTTNASLVLNATYLMSPSTVNVTESCVETGNYTFKGIPTVNGNILRSNPCVESVGRCVGDATCWKCFGRYANIGDGDGTRAANFGFYDLAVSPTCSPTPQRNETKLQRVLETCNPPKTELQQCLPALWKDMFQGANCTKSILDAAYIYMENVTNATAPTLATWFAALQGTPCHLTVDVGSTHKINNTLDTLFQTSACAAIAADIRCQFSVLACNSSVGCAACLASYPTSSNVEIRYKHVCASSNQYLALATSCFQSTYKLEYMKCSRAVSINNVIVWFTSVFGLVSIISVFLALAVSYGYRKGVHSLRERILVGMFVANIVYSSASMIPSSLEESGDSNCGDPVTSTATVATVRALWMMGKYMMLAYEGFVIYASVVALRTGSVNMKWKNEIGAHAGCAVLGLCAFISFFVLGHRYQAIATETASAPESYEKQRRAETKYDDLVTNMIQTWLVLLLLMFMLWGYQRFLFARMHREMLIARDRVTVEVSTQHFQGNHKLTLLELQLAGWTEVAKPLEPYVAVFILFAIPATVMGTDTCESDSNLADADHDVSCEHICEMVLALRTLATVLVYFSFKENRVQLFNFRLLCVKVGRRFVGHITCSKASASSSRTVRFSRGDGLESVELIPGNDENTTIKPIHSADKDVTRRGPQAMLRLFQLDELEDSNDFNGAIEETTIPYELMQEDNPESTESQFGSKMDHIKT
eukprot:m.227430 g.227430  ORF g.227430 m.227430 type:complete len:1154 (-) comp33520_c1_seq1:83-3544(-)